MTAPVRDIGAVIDREFGEGPAHRALAARIDRLIVALDAALTRQVNMILHHPDFRAMEARWRALDRLVDQAQSGPERVLIRVLNVSWSALLRDLERAVDFDQSHIYQLIYDGEFGMPGGLPFGLIVGDYEVSAATDRTRGDQVEGLGRLSGVAAASFCPVILGAAPDLLGVDDFADIPPYADLTEPRVGRQSQGDAIRWDALRQRDDTRFIGLVAPRVALRRAYRRYEVTRTDGFTFDEAASRPLFVSGAFAFASTVIAAFHDTGWYAAIRGAFQDESGGGRVPGFGAYDFGTDRHRLSAQPPVQTRFTSAQEDALIARGIVPLTALYLEPEAVFTANPSLHRPESYDSPVANENARIGAMLQYVLCASRFAHYLKVMMRDAVGTVADARTIENDLSEWLRGYCLGNDDADQDLKAAYPLRDGSVSVSPVSGRPGVYAATVRLQPHFQLDDVSTSFHLISETTGQTGPKRTYA
ncbi:type VI secretion system contractile sheath large subunit [Roseobacter weihaiensis]|uniref:type VI secretion system contractile sheath large subunit n=1 Tax=Roseobacter weihaiensis TaxID=2763262 RepID=UPI001D0AA92B|nr:type VI secretion system contractile sheath large subunit [Roseobacter sp. H9]